MGISHTKKKEEVERHISITQRKGVLPQDHYKNKQFTEPNANNFIFGTTIREVCSPQDPTKPPLS